MVRRGVVVLVVMVLIGIVLAVVTWTRGPGTVYTVAQVAAGLRRHPRTWVGRTVTVRGTAVMVEWYTLADAQNGVIGQAGCIDAKHCSMHVPGNTGLDLFLVGPLSQPSAATYLQLRTVLAS